MEASTACEHVLSGVESALAAAAARGDMLSAENAAGAAGASVCDDGPGCWTGDGASESADRWEAGETDGEGDADGEGEGFEFEFEYVYDDEEDVIGDGTDLSNETGGGWEEVDVADDGISGAVEEVSVSRASAPGGHGNAVEPLEVTSADHGRVDEEFDGTSADHGGVDEELDGTPADRDLADQSLDGTSADRDLADQSLDGTSADRDLADQSLDGTSADHDLADQSLDGTSADRDLADQSLDGTSADRDLADQSLDGTPADHDLADQSLNSTSADHDLANQLFDGTSADHDVVDEGRNSDMARLHRIIESLTQELALTRERARVRSEREAATPPSHAAQTHLRVAELQSRIGELEHALHMEQRARREAEDEADRLRDSLRATLDELLCAEREIEAKSKGLVAAHDTLAKLADELVVSDAHVRDLHNKLVSAAYASTSADLGRSPPRLRPELLPDPIFS
ncbi:uncharacterized protein AMSG_03818 [Thecamonas trahens ATCC 50062]|uniref:Uncharacterized protein n=1 Tax=Thecamonas trahens ATCC 50062 TaxID=461836 RepID=A0A0L0D4X6_THETB|nr:hypothetical protein AMSG_03818 [Thecamonas trahens ATCC 50062]KNC47384.1 hypothetical protein AMSG_03818 [Thecamonas trahens ATCC 50062]|eukprot:XP_013759722.1 hypothetical protein AMSG_03818 [Thecamonas trahens ATCC 50062]